MRAPVITNLAITNPTTMNTVPREGIPLGHLNGRSVTVIDSENNSSCMGPGLITFILIGLFTAIVAGLAIGYANNSLKDGVVLAGFILALTLLIVLIVYIIKPLF